jgi:hypothetical protein
MKVKICIWCGNPLAKDGGCNWCGNPNNEGLTMGNVNIKAKASKTPPAPKSTEFKLLFATTQTTRLYNEAEEGKQPTLAAESHGRPSPPTVVTFVSRTGADLAYEQVAEFNSSAIDVKIHCVKLYK